MIETPETAAAQIVAGLNPQQLQAVTTDAPAVLVVAGAGSGKTRVLTRRIAYLLATGRAHPSQILAITFTNKAAKEMRERVAALVHEAAEHMWVATFHSTCVRILRREYKHVGLRSTFSIYDAADQRRLVKMICKDRAIDDKRWPDKLIAGRISDLKNQLLTPADAAELAGNPTDEVVARVYQEYQQRLQAANAVDFDDLIMKTVQLLEQHPLVAESYRRRFRYILVDEYQDTNHAQYRLIRALVGTGRKTGINSATTQAEDASEQLLNDNGAANLPPANLFVVGDSDQSIYAFRGATIRNIEEFEEDFPNAQTILLEQNYRSTQTILSAANAVIAQNKSRRAKRLWTDAGDGEKIVYDVCDSDRGEAKAVVANIDQMLAAGYSYSDIAVFYRTNAQSRVLEDMFMRGGIPYRVIGGTKFYERAEVKDALAYLRAVNNPLDELSFARIINTPRRGIGDSTLAALRAHAELYQLPLPLVAAHIWYHQLDPAERAAALADGPDITGIAKPVAASETVAAADGAAGAAALQSEPPQVIGVAPRVAKKIAELWQLLIDARRQDEREVPVADILDQVLATSGYLAKLEESNDPQDASRVENLAELHSVATEFAISDPQGRLREFLEQVSLVADADQVESVSGQVTLMTVHTAKGLEYPVVFVTGMEDGTFPHQRALGSEAELAEERRLAYVAITRARERLFLSRAAFRNQWGMPVQLGQSRFVAEIPEELVEENTHLLSSGLGAYGSGSGYRAGGAGRGADDDVKWQAKQDTFFAADMWDDADSFGSGRGSERSRRGQNRTGSRSDSRAGSRGRGSGRSNSWVNSLRTTPRATAPRRMEAATPAAKGPRLSSVEVGERVHHPSHGMGKVTDTGGSGANAYAVVDFGGGNVKRLILKYAPLERI